MRAGNAMTSAVAALCLPLWTRAPATAFHTITAV
jgi:hypothetical protein